MAARNAKHEDQIADSAVDSEDDLLESVIEYSEDISDAERPDPLPAAEYEAEIIEAKRHVSQSSGKTSVMIQWQISEDNQPADYVERWGRGNISLRTYHKIVGNTPQERYNAKRLCQSIGAPMGSRLDLSEWKGLGAKIEIKHEDDLEGLPSERAGRISKL